MATITLKPIRQHTTVTLPTTLTDNGVRASWPDFTHVAAFIYSERQRIITGQCEVEIDSEDDTLLICRYRATQAQHLGIQKLVIQCEYEGQMNTYDKRAFQFVATTDETLTDGTTVAEETAEVDINVEDVDTSVMSGAIAAALAAAAAANAAASHAPYIDDTTGNWFVWDATAGEYVNSGTSATGPEGPAGQDGQYGRDGADGRDGQDGADGQDGQDGRDGGILYPTFKIDAAMHLQMSDQGESANQRFEVNEAGHFIMDI